MRHRQRGFNYLGLLFIVAVISLVAAASVQVGAIMQRRAAEEQLIFVGLQYKQAIRSYFEASPPGAVTMAPRRLEDLLKDPRYPYPKRHLRKLYEDPMTGKTDWALIRTLDGQGILGVRSRSHETPIRIDNFPDEVFHFKDKKRYADWVFVYGVVCSDRGCEIGPQQDDPGSPTP
ncbi:type II secretion system GspH family protein [Candidatus Dactylopiibacterium carminicum]|nr:type II secretion system GspH family protein [Candidatus Dactylopiibacterium carminicum]